MPIADFQDFCELVDGASPTLKKPGEMTLTCSENRADKKTKLEGRFSIKVDTVGSDLLEFEVAILPFKIFQNAEDFRKRTGRAEPGYFDKDLAMLSYFDSPVFFDIHAKKSYVSLAPTAGSLKIKGDSLKPSADFFLFINCESYIELLAFLKTKEHQEDYRFHFVDHYDTANWQFIFTSAKQAGKLVVSVPEELPAFDVTKDVSKYISAFKACFDEHDATAQLPKFIKAQLFEVLAHENADTRMKTWIDKMPTILEVAQQNHEVYLSDLSLEKFRQDYIEQKDKYISQLREILGKIATQIIGLPIAVTATAAAAYTFPANAEVRMFVILVFIFYSALAVILLKLQKDDVSSLKNRVVSEFDGLKSNTYFRLYPDELNNFNVAKDELLQKSWTLSKAISLYVLILILTNSWLLNLLISPLRLPDARFYPFVLALFLLILFILPYSHFAQRMYNNQDNDI